MRTHLLVRTLALCAACLASGLIGRPASCQELTRTLTSPTVEAIGSFGHSVAGVGDVDGSGTADVVVGAQNETVGATSQVGRAHVFDGSSGNIIRTLLSPNPVSSGFFGASVSGAGDVNDDGNADVVVGARDEDGGAERAGRAYVFSGANGDLLLTLQSPNPEMFGLFGASVSGAGDVDDDGHADLAVGSEVDFGALSGAGRVHIMSGLDGGALQTLVSPDPEAAGFFGRSVAATGALLGPGSDGVIVGAMNEDGGGSFNAGRAYVFGFEFAGPTAVQGPPAGAPRGLLLVQNRPNPFNPHTTIEFRLSRAGAVILQVFDAAGREISTLLERTLAAGSHEVVFDGAGLASGVYHYRLIVDGEESDSKRMLLVK
ncbi:MAG: FG-GAP repeat protein [bacterium]|nr:FG-GAP repeat protein [bacterium]